MNNVHKLIVFQTLPSVDDHLKSGPATVIPVPADGVIDAPYLKLLVQKYSETDDVFSPAFLAGLIFYGPNASDKILSNCVKQLLEDWHTQWTYFQPTPQELHDPLEAGPCVVYNGTIHTIWRIYDDPQLAFVRAVWPLSHSAR